MKIKNEITQLKTDFDEIQEKYDKEIAELQQKIRELVHIVVTQKKRYND